MQGNTNIDTHRPMRSNRRTQAMLCSSCNEPFRLAEEVFACPEDAGFHHARCWSSTATCVHAATGPAPIRLDAEELDRKPCPHCGAPIKHAAKLCRFCKRLVQDDAETDVLRSVEAASAGPPSKKGRGLLIAAIGAVALAIIVCTPKESMPKLLGNIVFYGFIGLVGKYASAESKSRVAVRRPFLVALGVALACVFGLILWSAAK